MISHSAVSFRCRNDISSACGVGIPFKHGYRADIPFECGLILGSDADSYPVRPRGRYFAQARVPCPAWPRGGCFAQAWVHALLGHRTGISPKRWPIFCLTTRIRTVCLVKIKRCSTDSFVFQGSLTAFSPSGVLFWLNIASFSPRPVEHRAFFATQIRTEPRKAARSRTETRKRHESEENLLSLRFDWQP